MNTLPRAIRQTLKYSDHFSFPLTSKEIYLRLISSRAYSQKTVSQALDSLVSQAQINKSGNYYYLPGHSALVSSRRQAKIVYDSLFLRAVDLASLIGHFPGVLAVYLTGSLAVRNPKVGDDIDFMVITQSSRLWTTRIIITIVTSLLGLRRSFASTRFAGKLCLNLYLTPQAFSIPNKKRSLYTAYELVQAVPLHDPYHTHRQLLAANPWIRSYLGNFPIPSSSSFATARPSWWLDYIESIAYRAQFFYMRPHLTQEYITPNSAFFHPHDPSQEILLK